MTFTDLGSLCVYLAVILTVALFLLVHRNIPWGKLWMGLWNGCTWCRENQWKAGGIAVFIWWIVLINLPLYWALMWTIGGFSGAVIVALAVRVRAATPLHIDWRNDDK